MSATLAFALILLAVQLVALTVQIIASIRRDRAGRFSLAWMRARTRWQARIESYLLAYLDSDLGDGLMLAERAGNDLTRMRHVAERMVDRRLDAADRERRWAHVSLAAVVTVLVIAAVLIGRALGWWLR